jgi:glycosyltransferase involved in cell wall biosynthesis
MTAPSIQEMAAAAGIRRVTFVAWRDLDHPAAGGSEVHANRIASSWAEAGLDVRLRTGRVVDRAAPARLTRGGVTVERVGGAVDVFLRTPWHEGRARRGDALVEVWHGVNFLAPLWARVPTIGIAHHVHAGQFAHVLPKPVAVLAAALERHLYPRVYRRTPLVTLSDSVRDELVQLGYRDDSVTVVTPGVDERFRPGGTRAHAPTLLVVARLMPQKRVDVVLRTAAGLRSVHADLEVVVVGDGPERGRLEAENAALGRPARFVGHLTDAELVEWYRRAWLLVSASLFEGWGMTITEAAACGTPAVASDIPGHRDAVADGLSGVLCRDGDWEATLGRLLADADERARLSSGALRHAAHFRWDEAARQTFAVLADAAARHR